MKNCFSPTVQVLFPGSIFQYFIFYTTTCFDTIYAVAYLGAGADLATPFGKNIFSFAIWKLGKHGLTLLCVSTSGQRKCVPFMKS